MSNSYPHQRTYTPPIPAFEITLQDPDDAQSIGPLVASLSTCAIKPVERLIVKVKQGDWGVG